MKVYISGPITGTPDYMGRFKRAERRIRAAGHEAVNPAAVNAGMPKSTTHEEYMIMSLTMQDMCDAIYVLEGWRNSKGSRMEVNHALHIGQLIEFEQGKGEGVCTSQSRQERENLAHPYGSRLWSEIWGNVFSAGRDIT